MRSNRQYTCDSKIVVLVFAFVVGAANFQLLAEPTNARTWPNWMGPNHDGISDERGWSTEWPEDGLPIVWQRQIGIGFSSVSIAGKHLFTMGHVDGHEVIYCLDLETGNTVWSYPYPAALVDNLHEGGPGSTPTIDGNHVYALGREGQLFCLRAADGQVVWSKSLQEDLGVSLPEWGFTSSAYILDDQLILEAGRVVAYEKGSGEKKWQTELHVAGYGSAAVVTHEETTLIATLDCEGLRIVRARDGEEVAFSNWPSRFETNATTPIVDGTRLFVSTGYNAGCAMFDLSDEGLELVQQNRNMRNHFNNSILLDGYLYGFDGNSNLGRVVKLTCMDIETGDVVWSKRGFGCGSLMIADKKLLILSEDGTLVVASASPNGYRELARSVFLEGRCWTVPVLFNGRVYGRNATGDLVCAELPETALSRR
jgi:outer membrane protein assembly factor BamB